MVIYFVPERLLCGMSGIYIYHIPAVPCSLCHFLSRLSALLPSHLLIYIHNSTPVTPHRKLRPHRNILRNHPADAILPRPPREPRPRTLAQTPHLHRHQPGRLQGRSLFRARDRERRNAREGEVARGSIGSGHVWIKA